MDIAQSSPTTFTLEESEILMSTDPNNSEYSLLSLENSKFLESQMTSPDLSLIESHFKLDSQEKASAILDFYKDIHSTLETYSPRFTIDYLKANWTQVGLMNAYQTTEIYTLNNITSSRLGNKITDQSLSCREVFNVNPYLEMCTHLELNIEYLDVVKLFVSAFFNLDSEKEFREQIKKIMGQNDFFIDGLFGESSKVQFNILIREVLSEISEEYFCQDSCRKVLAETQFVYSNLFEKQGYNSLISIPGNEGLLPYIPELKSYIQLLLDSKYSSEDTNSQEPAICDFLSQNVLNFNANSIFNVNQLSLFFTYSELNNKYNLLNFLKIRCDPDVLLQSLEYFFISWGLPDFYMTTKIKNVFESYTSSFLQGVKSQNKINGGLPNLNPKIDFKILETNFKMQSFTGKDNLSNLRRLIHIDEVNVEDQNLSSIFEALLDYKNLKGVELLAQHMKLKSSTSGKKY